MSTISNSTSKRYVFFKSLTEQKHSWLYPMLNDAYSRLSTINNNIGIGNPYDVRTKEHLERIKKYLDFIKEMRDNLNSNELAFLEQQNSLLKKDENLKFQELYNGFKNGKVEYQELIRAFNLLFQDQEKYEQILQSETTRMRAVKDTYLDFDSHDWIDKLYETNYKKYAGIMASSVKKKTRIKTDNDKWIDQYGHSISEQLAFKANQILRNLSANDVFINNLISKLSENIKMSDSEFKTLIINIIANEVVNSKLEDTSDDILNHILQEADKDLIGYVNSIKDAEFSRIVVADDKSLEEIVLATQDSLKEYLSLLDDKSFKNIAENYPETAKTIEKLNAVKTDATKYDQMLAQVAKEIGKAIRNKASQILQQPITSKMRRATFATQFGNMKDFITPTQISDQLQKSLKGIHFSHDMIGEILASNDTRQRIKNVIVNNLPGVSISFKADIRFSTGYVGSDEIQISDRHFKKIQTIINSAIDEHYDQFLLMYKEAAGGQTDIKAAMDTYKLWLNKMKQSLDNLIDADEDLKQRFKDRTKLYEELYNTFSNSVSVKDYTLYNNELGFHGGSLGSKTAPEKVIDNITEMYTLGGISSADAEEILFAVINCGSAMIGENIKPSLEQYLLGGAALIMFDDSFAASNTFLNQLTDSFKGQRIINLYRINQFFVPASFILDEIYNNLVQVYQHTVDETTFQNIKQHNRVTIINDNTYDSVQISGDTPQERAESVSKYVLSNISIQFSFMGGLLDIMEKELTNITKIR